MEDVNAKSVIQKVHELYTKNGIVAIGSDLDLCIYSPRKKVSVMIIGNHSAGKSSFINWYIQDKIQNTGVAIETQGFTFVTSGMKQTKAPIKGESTIMLFPYLAKLKEEYGKSLVENLWTSVSTSKARNFSLVDIIDTPGLVDGDIAYPFDVNRAIVSMAEHADLIFVFLDPMGQALCSRTMKVVKSLNVDHYDKMNYFLSKADTVTTPKDLMKLMVQITQNIKENISNQHGLEIPMFWLPTQDRGQAESIAEDPDLNQIEQLCDIIDISIHHKVQDNLSHLEKDCEAIVAQVQILLRKDRLQRAAKNSRCFVALLLIFMAWMLPFVIFVFLVTAHRTRLPIAIQRAEIVKVTLNGVQNTFAPNWGITESLKWVGGSIIAFLLLNTIGSFIRARANKFQTTEDEKLKRWEGYEKRIKAILKERQELFSEYVHTYTNESKTA